MLAVPFDIVTAECEAHLAAHLNHAVWKTVVLRTVIGIYALKDHRFYFDDKNSRPFLYLITAAHSSMDILVTNT
jgi:hypothetical protein